MIEISGKVDKPNTDNGFNISFFVLVLFLIKNEILNSLKMFDLSIFPLIFTILSDSLN